MTQKIITKQSRGLYDEYLNQPTWKILENALQDLGKNQDIKITTDSYYIIGYLCKCLDRIKK